MKVLILLLLFVTLAINAEQFQTKKDGVSGGIKLIHVLHEFDPQTGSTVGFNLKYRTKSFNGLQGNIGFHCYN